MAVVIATGITADGDREVLGVDIGDSEDEVFWRGFLRSLKSRGLGGVRLVISDQHAGLVAALRRSFQGASHQRCRVHFARNLLALVPKSHQDMVAAVFRTIFAQPDPATVAATWDQVRDQLADRFPKIGPLMDDAKAEVLAFSAFPRAHWTKVWSTNPLERLNKEVKRRARVVGIFPNEASVIRLVGAVLADVHDEWQAGDRRYLSEGSMALLYPERDTDSRRRTHTRRLTPRITSKTTTRWDAARGIGRQRIRMRDATSNLGRRPVVGSVAPKMDVVPAGVPKARLRRARERSDPTNRNDHHVHSPRVRITGKRVPLVEQAAVPPDRAVDNENGLALPAGRDAHRDKRIGLLERPRAVTLEVQRV